MFFNAKAASLASGHKLRAVTCVSAIQVFRAKRPRGRTHNARQRFGRCTAGTLVGKGHHDQATPGQTSLPLENDVEPGLEDGCDIELIV